MVLQNYYSRFNAADKYDELLFRASKGLQSAELNEVQQILGHRITQIADVLFQAGGVVRGGQASINAQTGVVQMDSGAVYVDGAVREVVASTFTIPTTGSTSIGVRVVETEVTEIEVAALRDPATGTRNYQEPGAGRKKVVVSWGWSGDGASGEFYATYEVLNGVLVDASDPPALDGVKTLLANYDFDANGSYIVDGNELIYRGKDTTQTNHVFSVAEGVSNVLGNKIDKPTATPLSFAIDPDLQTISNEPRTSANAGTQTITTSKSPLNNIIDVVITEEVTATITHGSFTGALDALPNTSVLNIQSVSQGGTTYQSGTDYVLTQDQVDWSPGGAEPAPGSTYSVTFQYLHSVTPTSIDTDAGTFEVTGAVVGSLVLTDYRWKLPRIDVVSLDSAGGFSRIKGVSSSFNPVEPATPESELKIAKVSHKWYSTETPAITNDGTRVMPYSELRRLKDAQIEIFKLLADERLQRDLASKEPTAKYGIFTDPLFDGDLRDAGVTQDAVIVDQELQLGITASSTFAAQNNSTRQLLPFVDEIIVEQALATGQMAINPYGNFDPLPARVSLDPNIDLFTVFDDQTTATTRRINRGGGLVARTETSTATTLVQDDSIAQEFMRSRSVDYVVSGFGGAEVLSALTFDGEDVLASATVTTADANGVLSGAFTIPSNIPAGTKLVTFTGAGGTTGSAEYTGQGTLRIRRWNQVTTITTTRFDPLAQSFTLTEGRQVTGVDLKFAAIGNTANDVLVQIRESDNGFPTERVLADGIIEGTNLSTANAYTRATFGSPVYLEANREYFIVISTDDATHALRVAELGQFDSTAQQWVSSQPYTIGVLLSSSNASTWTPHQSKDLTFRLAVADFTSTTQTINLGSITVSNMTDLQVLAPIDLPENDSSIVFRYTRGNGEVFELSNGMALQFETSISDTLQIQAILGGNAKVSPILFPGVQSITGTLDVAAFYQGRSFQVNSTGTTLKIIFEANIPGTSTVTPEYENGGFQSLTLSSTTPIGDGFNEYVYSDTGIVGMTATAVKLSLAGSAASRPRVRNIRAVMV